MPEEAENMLLFTIIVDQLDVIDGDHLENLVRGRSARECARLMADEDPELSGLIEQLQFYWDVAHGWGIFTGIVKESLVTDADGAVDGKAFAVRLLQSRGLTDSFSWILVGLEGLASGYGELVIDSASGQVGGHQA